MPLNARYWIKTALHCLTPGGYGYARVLRRHRNPQYNHARDRHPVRQKHHGHSGWLPETNDIARRSYADYQEYVTHQQQKYREILQMYGGFGNQTIVEWRQRFYRRFRHLLPLLGRDARILCLGARQGTEVEVLRDLGFKHAYGIDLNPGPDNPFVRTGDFMHLAEAAHSLDCIYTNSIDHAFDLDPFVAEHKRVLKPNGLALYDLPRYSGTRAPGAFEAIGWQSEAEIISRLARSYQRQRLAATERKWQWVLFEGPRTD